MGFTATPFVTSERTSPSATPSDMVRNIIIYQINLIFQCKWQVATRLPGAGNLVAKIPVAETGRIKTIKQNIKKFKPFFWMNDVANLFSVRPAPCRVISAKEVPYFTSGYFPRICIASFANCLLRLPASFTGFSIDPRHSSSLFLASITSIISVPSV